MSKGKRQAFNNGNYLLSDKEVDAIKADLSRSQLEWNAHFNRGDYNYCADQYLEDGIVFARPVGTFRGREAVRGFWKKVRASFLAALLIYSNMCNHIP